MTRRSDRGSAVAFVQGANRGSAFSRIADRAFMLVLFAAIILSLLGLLALGSSVYGMLVEDRSDAAALRQDSGFILNVVRAGDAVDAVETGEGPEGAALVLVERLESGTFETRLYSYDGAVVEEYTVAGDSYDPQRAVRVADSQTFDFSYDEEAGLLTVWTDAGEARIALRCG